MYDKMKVNEIYMELKRENPNYDSEMVERFKDRMPEEFARLMYEEKYGCHIVTKEMYDKAVSYLTWTKDKGKGAKWEVEKIIEIANIDFSEVKYYEYDFAYVMNMLYSDYCDIFTETSYYLKMAKTYLEDPDYPGKADERAYYSAEKRINYFEKK